MVKELFAKESDGFKLISVLVIIFLMAAAVSILSILIAMPVFKLSFSEIQLIIGSSNFSGNIGLLKFLQFFQSVGLFIVPALMYKALFTYKHKDELQLKSSPATVQTFIILITLVASSPLINFLLKLNSMMSLPDFLSGLENWMMQAEKSAEKLTNAFLMDTSIKALMINILMIAIIPSIGEELIFRGILQNLFSKILNNAHWGILVSSFLFSAFHLQFYGFLPRLLLGMYLGYLLYWTSNLWYPILGHFINNTFAVLYTWYSSKNNIDINLDTIGFDKSTFIYVPFSVVIVMLGLMMSRKIASQKVKTGPGRSFF